ncbi:hypothetical protein [Mesorhizobium sp.]|uniref:hypothetical protein n=1 Tax=Mesorhizobium sp. TaxID=1871066 RepID=UPI000FE587C1|nr:hypothetical protein [Mesorhizobium sp.]RWO17525.1 MAG: hypothetical protein EOS15_03030 [Mesorhizobium sp.]
MAAPAGYGKTTAVIDYLESVEAPHVWFRIDEGDQDIARFFQYLAQSLASPAVGNLPVFGVEYVEQPKEFARRFFRAYFARFEARHHSGPRRLARRRHARIPGGAFRDVP